MPAHELHDVSDFITMHCRVSLSRAKLLKKHSEKETKQYLGQREQMAHWNLSSAVINDRSELSIFEKIKRG